MDYTDYFRTSHETWVVETKIKLSTYLKTWINNSDLTQSAAAEKLEISLSSVGNIMKGDIKTFSIDFLLKALSSIDYSFDLQIHRPTESKF